MGSNLRYYSSLTRSVSKRCLCRKKIKVDETSEIRCQLHRDGRYEETKYFIRYFQLDGAGMLKMSDGTVLLPNDLYPLPGETFRLYYTSASTDQQTVDVYFQDSFGQLQLLTFSFNNDSSIVAKKRNNLFV